MGCQLCPWLGLCSPSHSGLPTALSSQVCIPIQFLKPGVEFSKPPGVLVDLRLQLSDRDGCHELHLRLRVAILSRAGGFGNTCQHVPFLADDISLRDCIGDRGFPVKGRHRVGSIDGLDQRQEPITRLLELLQQLVWIFGGLLAFLHPRRSQNALPDFL